MVRGMGSYRKSRGSEAKSEGQSRGISGRIDERCVYGFVFFSRIHAQYLQEKGIKGFPP
jgi:hypothetical protein